MRRPIIIAGVLVGAVALVGAFELGHHRPAPESAAAADRAALTAQLAAAAAAQQHAQQQLADLQAKLAGQPPAGGITDQTSRDEIARLQASLDALRAQQAANAHAGATASLPPGAAPTGKRSSNPLVSSVPSQGPVVSPGGDLQPAGTDAGASGVTVYGPGDIGTATLTAPAPTVAGAYGIGNGAAPPATPGNGGVVLLGPSGVAPVGTVGAGGVSLPPSSGAAPPGTPGNGGVALPPPGLGTSPGLGTTRVAPPRVNTAPPAPGVSSNPPAPGVSSSPPAPGVSSNPPAPGVSPGR